VSPLVAGDLAAVRALHALEASLTLRSAEDEARLFAVPGARGFALRAPDGAPLAYAVVGRGADFPFHLHEWGGDDAAVEALVLGVAALHRGRSITVLVPSFREGLASRLAARGAAREEHPLALAKVLRPDALIAGVNGLWAARGAATRARREGALVVVEGPGAPPRRLDEAEWLRAIVGPGARAALPDLPLPFFVWGMDSI
jgi:hypothetical protein